MTEDLNLTERELLMDIRADIKVISRDVAVLTSQALNDRITRLEAFQNKAEGTMFSIKAVIAILSGVATIAGVFLFNR